MRTQTSQKSPKEVSRGKSSLVTLKNQEIGTLIKEDGTIYLRFGDTSYRPETDAALLEEAGILKQVERDGKVVKTLYIEEDSRSRIYLKEYLDTFSTLSEQGIDIAFAKKVR